MYVVYVDLYKALQQKNKNIHCKCKIMYFRECLCWIKCVQKSQTDKSGKCSLWTHDDDAVQCLINFGHNAFEKAVVMVHLGLSILLGVVESLPVEYVGIWSGDSHHLSSVSQHGETEELGDKHLPDTQFLHQVHPSGYPWEPWPGSSSRLHSPSSTWRWGCRSDWWEKSGSRD